MATHRFTVSYLRTRKDETTVEGRTIVTSARSNLGLARAQDKLKMMFNNTSTLKIEATGIEPYLSGSDIVKARRQVKGSKC